MLSTDDHPEEVEAMATAMTGMAMANMATGQNTAMGKTAPGSRMTPTGAPVTWGEDEHGAERPLLLALLRDGLYGVCSQESRELAANMDRVLQDQVLELARLHNLFPLLAQQCYC